MGIHKLMSLISDKAPEAIKRREISQYGGRTVAVDASMAMYQFLVSTQHFSHHEFAMSELTDSEGNKTGHLVGLFYRSLTLLDHGIKPVWVFDGTPPEMKMEELQRRKAAKAEAVDLVDQKIEEGNIDEAAKQAQRTVGISKEMKEDAMKMLRLMGMTVVQAKSEAEAQCAQLARDGKVHGVVTDDMDTLTFRTPLLLRGFHNKKDPVTEIDYEAMLSGFDLTYPEFVDLCILCGCDYTPTVDGIGPVTAYKLIKAHSTLENVLVHLEKENQREERKKKFNIPQELRDRYQMARQMFTHPEVFPSSEVLFIKGAPKPDEEQLMEFLVKDKAFNQQRVESGLKKIKNFQIKGAQSHIEAFFGKPKINKSSTPQVKKQILKKKGKK